MATESSNVVDEVEEAIIPQKSKQSSGMTKKRPKKNSSDGAKDPTTKRKPRKKKRSKDDEDAAAALIKYAALFLLVAQMVGLVLLMRYSRTSAKPEDGGPLYLASTAVAVMESLKLAICCGVIAWQSGGRLLSELKIHVLNAPVEIIKLSVPSFLYTVQNNLLYFGELFNLCFVPGYRISRARKRAKEIEWRTALRKCTQPFLFRRSQL